MGIIVVKPVNQIALLQPINWIDICCDGNSNGPVPLFMCSTDDIRNFLSGLCLFDCRFVIGCITMPRKVSFAKFVESGQWHGLLTQPLFIYWLLKLHSGVIVINSQQRRKRTFFYCPSQYCLCKGTNRQRTDRFRFGYRTRRKMFFVVVVRVWNSVSSFWAKIKDFFLFFNFGQTQYVLPLLPPLYTRSGFGNWILAFRKRKTYLSVLFIDAIFSVCLSVGSRLFVPYRSTIYIELMMRSHADMKAFWIRRPSNSMHASTGYLPPI